MSRVTQDTAMLHFASHTGLSPSMVTFSKVFCSQFAYNVAVLQPQPRLATPLVWAVPRSLATTGGIIHLFSLPAGTKMFQFPALALKLLSEWPSVRRPGCPIRKSPDQGSFAPTRGLSQLITSFVASVSLGIRHTPFLTFFITVFSFCFPCGLLSEDK